MALVTCAECGKDVSERAARCPNCGNPLRAAPQVEIVEKNKHPLLTFLGGAVIVLAAIGFISNIVDNDDSASPKPQPTARFKVTDVLMDEGCTSVGDYCVNVHCTYQNEGNAAGAFRVRARLVEKGSNRAMAERFTELTLLPGATQRVSFAFREAELEHQVGSVCMVD